MARTMKPDHALARTLRKRRIAEVRYHRTPNGSEAVCLALDDGTAIAFWLWPGAKPGPGRYLSRTHEELEYSRRHSRGSLRKFYARALNRLRSWETGWNMPRNRRVSVREPKRTSVRVRPHGTAPRPSPTHHA